MQRLEIRGGKKISGTIVISGSKNATLPILASTILTDKKVIIKNIPIVRDVETMTVLLKTIVKDKIKYPTVNKEIVKEHGLNEEEHQKILSGCLKYFNKLLAAK